MNAIVLILPVLLAAPFASAARERHPEFVHNGVAIFTTRHEYDPDARPDPDLPRKIHTTLQEAIGVSDTFMRDALGPEFPLHVSSVALLRLRMSTTGKTAWLWGVTYLNVEPGPTLEQSFIIGPALTVWSTTDSKVLMRKGIVAQRDDGKQSSVGFSPPSILTPPQDIARTDPMDTGPVYSRNGIGIAEHFADYEPGPFNHGQARKRTLTIPQVVAAADAYLRSTFGKDFPLDLGGIFFYRTSIPQNKSGWLWKVDYIYPEDRALPEQKSKRRFEVTLAPDGHVLMRTVKSK